MNRKLKKILSVLLVIILVMTMVPFSAAADDGDEEDIEAKKERLKELEALIQEYRNNANEQAALAEALQEEIKILDSQMTQVETEIVALNGRIDETQLRLDHAETNLAKANADYTAYKNQLEERMVAMYMYGDQGYLEVLFGSQSFSDFISRATAIASIMSYDREIAKRLKDTENLIEAQKVIIEEQKARLDEMMVELQLKEADLESSKAVKRAAMEEVEALQAYWTEQAENYHEEAYELRKALAEEGSGSDYANTYQMFLWPTPGYYGITSDYGWRICPFHGHEFHTGIDIGAPRNAKAIAPCNGRVTRASWYGGYGNCIILDLGTDIYGNTYKCLYAHLNSYAVDVGDIVTQGQTVGYVGTTGDSTGYHLHFEIHVGGDTVNPVEWLTK